MSNEKLSRYKRRINLTFSDYSRKRKKSEKAARKLLEKRVRFLTSNTRLVNNKKNVMTGIYFSNPLLNSMEDLKALDRHLQSRVTKLKNSLLISRLQKLSYEYGFQSRQFRKFSAKDLSEIVKVWKYAK